MDVRAAQRAARLRVAPGLLARAFVARPGCVCAAAAVVPLLALAAVVASGSFVLRDPGFRDYLIRGSERVRVDDAAAVAERDGEVGDVAAFLAGGGLGGVGEGGVAAGSQVEGEMGMSLLWRVAGEGGAVARDLGEGLAVGGNVLTREVVAEMKRLEDEFVGDPGYSRFCYRDPASLGCDGTVPEPDDVACRVRQSVTAHPLLYGEPGKAGPVCGVRAGHEPVSAARFADFLAAVGGDGGVESSVLPLLGRDANETAAAGAPATFLARSVFEFALPVLGYARADEEEDAQKAEFRDWIVPLVPDLEGRARGNVRLSAVGAFYSNSVFGETATRDLTYAVAAIVLVLLFMWVHTQSLFLAAAAMLQVVLAFPLAFALYRLVAQIEYFSSLQIMTIFLLLGIAADDAFVMVDAWRQSAVVLGADCDLPRRMCWTYRRAVKAMAVTSFTTALAFAFTAVSPVMPVGTLGAWAAVLVLVQYALVISMFPCAVIIWHRSLRPRTWATRFRLPNPPALITREDDERHPQGVAAAAAVATAEALDGAHVDMDVARGSSAVKNMDAARGSSAVLIENTGAEAGLEEEGESAERGPLWKRCLRRGQRNENEYRPVEKFFRYKWVFWMEKIKYALAAVAAVLIGVSIYFATKLGPLRENEEFLSKDNPLRIATSLQLNAFPNLNARYTIVSKVFWGVLDIDRSSVSQYDPSAIGEATYDRDFDLKSAAAQQHILDACASFESNPKIAPTLMQDNPVECWVRDFASWRKDELDKDDFETYGSDAELGVELRSFFDYKNESTEAQPYLKHLTNEFVVFSEDGQRVTFTSVEFRTDIKDTEPARVTWPYYETWQEAVDEQAAEAPVGVSKPLITLGYASMWAVTTRTLIRNAFIGVGIMLGVALVILSLSTANVIVALFAFVAIGGIVTNLLALIQLWGFQMGLTESVSVIIAAGVSFDFCSHIANAYTESPASKRFDRTRDALTDLGISVLAGGLSTMISAATLFLATITFFKKFARFVVCTVALSLMWSLMFLIAFLLIAGPEKEFGSLMPVFRKLTPCLNSRRAEKKGGDGGSSSNLSGSYAGADAGASSAEAVGARGADAGPEAAPEAQAEVV